MLFRSVHLAIHLVLTIQRRSASSFLLLYLTIKRSSSSSPSTSPPSHFPAAKGGAGNSGSVGVCLLLRLGRRRPARRLTGAGAEYRCRRGGAPPGGWLGATAAAGLACSGGSVARQIWRPASTLGGWLDLWRRRGRRSGGAARLPVAEGFWGGLGEITKFSLP